MTNENLRMQMLSGIITEGEYKAKLEENANPILDVVTVDGKKAVGTHQEGIGFKPNENGKKMGFKANKDIPNGTKVVPSNMGKMDAMGKGRAMSVNESMIGGIITEGEYKAKLQETQSSSGNLNRVNKNKALKVGDVTTFSSGKNKGKKVKVVKVLDNGKFEVELLEKEKASLNESMIGGIVGIGAINQIPPRAKADYEMAFEHFLGERYTTNFENREQDPYTMEEDDSSNDMGQQIVNLKDGEEEIRLSNEILEFLEGREMIDPSNAQKIHPELTAFLKNKVKFEKLSIKENNPLTAGAGFASKKRMDELAQLIKSAKLELARQRDMMTPESIAKAEETLSGLIASHKRAIEKYKAEIKDNYSGMSEGEKESDNY